MHEGRRAERRLARQAEVDERRAVLAERHAVGGGELHEQVVRVLAVDEMGCAVGRLAGLEQQRIAALALGRIEREHGPQAERSRAGRPVAHQHQHARGEGLVVAARTGLPVVDEVDVAVRHERPGALGQVQTRHRRRLGLPGSAGALARHRVRTQGAPHVRRAVLARRRVVRRRLVVLRHVVPGHGRHVVLMDGAGRGGSGGCRSLPCGATRCRRQAGGKQERQRRSEQLRQR